MEGHSLSTKATIVIGIFAALLTLSTFFKPDLERFIIVQPTFTAWSISLIVTVLLIICIYIYSLGYIAIQYPNVVGKLKILRNFEQFGDIFFMISLSLPILIPIFALIINIVILLLQIFSPSVEKVVSLFIKNGNTFAVLSVTIAAILQTFVSIQSIKQQQRSLKKELSDIYTHISNIKGTNNEYYLLELVKALESQLIQRYYAVSNTILYNFQALTNIAYQDKVITASERTFLLDLWRIRNSLSHGRPDGSLVRMAPNLLKELIQKSERILEKLKH